METDVLIIGAGPAGLSAAYETASRGLKVTIVDESEATGGQLCQQTQVIQSLPSSYLPIRGFELAERLTKSLQGYSIRFLLGHRVIGLYEDGSIGIANEENVFPVKAKKMIIATGAAEKALPFPKWTLPGIITIGAAQTLINRDFVLPGKAAIIVGSSEFAMELALLFLAVGIKVKGIVEKKARVTAENPDLVLQVQETGVPIFLNSTIKEARGNGEVEEIDIQMDHQVMTVAVDLVCIDGGRTPILDVFYQLNCSFGYQEKLGGWIPQYNSHLQTNHKEIYLAGNTAGISSHGVLILTGKIAGIGVCESLNLMNKEEAGEKRASIWKEIKLLESKFHQGVWQGRAKHIDNFMSPMLKDQFIS